MVYYAKLTKQAESWLVEVPGCLTDGRSKKLALANAQEAFNGWLVAACDRNLDIPNAIARKARSYHAIDS